MPGSRERRPSATSDRQRKRDREADRRQHDRQRKAAPARRFDGGEAEARRPCISTKNAASTDDPRDDQPAASRTAGSSSRRAARSSAPSRPAAATAPRTDSVRTGSAGISRRSTPQQAPAWPIARQAALSGRATALNTAQSSSGGRYRDEERQHDQRAERVLPVGEEVALEPRQHALRGHRRRAAAESSLRRRLRPAALIARESPRGGCTSS